MRLLSRPEIIVSLAVLVMGYGCLAKSNPVTYVSVSNRNPSDLSVTIIPVGGGSFEIFQDVVGRAATSFRELPFEQFESIDVSCEDGGCLGGRLTLTQGARHTIFIVQDEAPTLSFTPPPPPVVTAWLPVDESDNVGLNSSLVVTFSLPMDPGTLTLAESNCDGVFQLSADNFQSCVPLASIESSDNLVFRVRPQLLAPHSTYSFRVSTLARALNGEALWAMASTTFTTGATGDTQSPSPVDDLKAEVVDATEVRLSWSAVGDDGNDGQAQGYDVRYLPGDCPLDFSLANPLNELPRPGSPGTQETVQVFSLEPETTYCFGLKVLDEVPNISPLSNQVSATTPVQSDQEPPATPTIVIEEPTADSLRVRWVAVGDDGHSGLATGYELRYLPQMCPEVSGTGFKSGNPVTGLQRPKSAGAPENILARGLTPDISYCFILAVFDDAGNVTFSAPVTGKTAEEKGYW